MRFCQSTHLLMCLSLQTLTFIIRTGLPILAELTDLVELLLGSLTVTLTVLLFWIYLFLLTLLFFSPLGNADHAVVSVSSDFTINSKATILVLIVMVFVIIWEMFHGRISWNSVFLLLLVNFVSSFRLELMYISIIRSIRSRLTHLLAFQLLF